MKKDKINPGPAMLVNTKNKKPVSPRGKPASSSYGKGGMSDEQFQGHATEKPGDLESGEQDYPGGMKDQQFTENDHDEDDGQQISAGGKPLSHKNPQHTSKNDGGSPGNTSVEPGNFKGDKQSSAMKIMREVAKAAQRPPKDQNPKQNKKVSNEGSAKQSSDFKKSSSKSAPQGVKSKESASGKK